MMRAAALVWIVLLAGCGRDDRAAERPRDPEAALLAELAGALDPSAPGLAPFFSAWEAGDAAAARERLLGYFRSRPIPAAALPEPLPVEQAVLVSALDAWRGTFSFQGAAGRAADPDGPIDWTHRGPRGDNEWAWFLHRHYFLREMLVLYQFQGHEEFAGRIRDYLLDWFWKHPPPGRRSFSAPWRALEAARRFADSWLPLYAELRDDPSFGDEATLAVIAGAARHADYLRHHHHFGGNHLVTEMMALAAIAAAWPEFRNAGPWMDYAVGRGLEEMERQVYPDGAHKELANHYQWIAGASFQRLYRIAAEAGRAAGADAMRVEMERFWNYYASVIRPDGTGPLNNDSDIEPNAEQMEPLAAYYERPDWLFMATGGERGEPPPGPPSRYFPWAGHAVLRSGWEKDADWVFFDLGAYGSDHQQEDRLHVSAALNGRNMLVDSGRYVYRDDAWSRFFRGARSHNVPVFARHERIPPDAVAPAEQPDAAGLDGALPLASGWIPLRAAGRPGWSGSHARTVVLGEGFVWIVDRVEVGAPDTVTFQWRFAPEWTLGGEGGEWRITDEGGAAASWTFRGAERFREETAQGRGPPAIQGWYAPQYNERAPNEVLLVSAAADGVHWFSWLLAGDGAPRGLDHRVAAGGAELLGAGAEGGPLRIRLPAPPERALLDGG
ncbi:MAG: heparinase II/III family protein [Puniceicoccaceae bacterium]